MDVKCPFCNYQYHDLAEAYRNQQITCSNCQNNFLATDSLNQNTVPIAYPTPFQPPQNGQQYFVRQDTGFKNVAIMALIAAILGVIGGIIICSRALIAAAVGSLLVSLTLFAFDTMAKNILRCTFLLERIAEMLSRRQG